MLRIHAFVIVGAWLMFMLQPLVGRLLLPVFGGGFHVWATCMMFFQGVLLLGYAYAHFALPRLGRLHLLLVAASLLSLPIGVSVATDASAAPLSIAALLLLQVGLPFGVLATTSVAAQLWLAQRAEGSGNPYSLYAASNVGSLLGLLSYPLLIEPLIDLPRQQQLWTAGYVLYAALAALVWARPLSPAPTIGAQRPVIRSLIYWFWLSAGGAALLLATTHLISLGAGSVPLVWVIALCTYLASFIAAFGRESPRWLTLRRYVPEAALLGVFCFSEQSALPERWDVVLALGVLYTLCWAAHLELYLTRPPAAQLTWFYLTLALGGLCGSAFVTLAAPGLFRGLQEYPLGLLVIVVTLAIGRRHAIGQWLRAHTGWAAPTRFHYSRWLRLFLLGAASAWVLTLLPASRIEARLRSPYGLFSVWETQRGPRSEKRTVRVLNHNHTSHGLQSLRHDERRTPAGYYAPQSPLGALLRELPRPARMGVVGLGTGTAAAYFGDGDEVVFYEIDPMSERLAHSRFSYLDDSRARTRVVIGDARVSLQRERGRPRYSALLIDAFSGDAIPFHLLTREALALYLGRVEPAAPVIFHISNRFYELWPTLAATAREVGALAAHRSRSPELGDRLGPLEWASQYLVVSKDTAYIEALGRRGWTIVDRPSARPWSDDRVNLIAALWSQFRGE